MSHVQPDFQPSMIHLEWRNRVKAEYSSAAIAARVQHLSILCGLPRDCLNIISRIVSDELDHAELCDQARVDLGDAPGALVLDIAGLWNAQPEPPLAELTRHLLSSFCIGETLAVPLFNHMRNGASHPAIQPALTRILKDESVHRAFGWRALDAILAIDQPGVSDLIRRQFPSEMRSFLDAYTTATSLEVSDEAREAGLISGIDYQDIVLRTFADVIVPRLRKRGIAVNEVPTPTA